jgi:hypothetical protein
MSRRQTFLLLTENGSKVHAAASAYGARLTWASGASMKTSCGLTAWPAKGATARQLPRCGRCFPAPKSGGGND